MINDSIHLSSKINNQAVECMNNGDLQKAFELLQVSLQLMVTEIKKTSQQGGSTSKAHSKIDPLPSKMEEYLLTRPASHTLVQTAGDRLHIQGLPMLDTPDACFSSEAMEEKTIRAAIIIFNLAIIFHLKGLREHSRSSMMISKNLYHRSHLLIVRIIGDLDSIGNEDHLLVTGNALIDLLAIALWNNLAQISMNLNDFVTSDVLFGKVIRHANIIHKMTDIYLVSGKKLSGFMEEQSQRFLHNATVCPLYYSTAAPAA